MNRRSFQSTSASAFAWAALAKSGYPQMFRGQASDKPFQPDRESLKSHQSRDCYRDAKRGIWAHWSQQCAPAHGDWNARLWRKFQGHTITGGSWFSDRSASKRIGFPWPKSIWTARILRCVTAAVDVQCDRLFSFLEQQGVEPTNNAAERALRIALQRRKASFGNRSAEGGISAASLLSVSRTCRVQNCNMLVYLGCTAFCNQLGAPVPSLLVATKMGCELLPRTSSNERPGMNWIPVWSPSKILRKAIRELEFGQIREASGWIQFSLRGTLQFGMRRSTPRERSRHLILWDIGWKYTPGLPACY